VGEIKYGLHLIVIPCSRNSLLPNILLPKRIKIIIPFLLTGSFSMASNLSSVQATLYHKQYPVKVLLPHLHFPAVCYFSTSHFFLLFVIGIVLKNIDEFLRASTLPQLPILKSILLLLFFPPCGFGIGSLSCYP